MADKEKLNAKQKRFVDEYVIDLNATQAAIRAGYSEKTAKEIGYELLTKLHIQEYLKERQCELSKRTEITQDMVLQELAKIGFADIRKAVKWAPNLGTQVVGEDIVQTNGVLLVDSEDLDDSTASAISEVAQTRDGIKIKFHDKQAALVSIGRHIGMFNDKLQLQGDKSNPLVMLTVNDDDLVREISELRTLNATIDAE